MAYKTLLLVASLSTLALLGCVRTELHFPPPDIDLSRLERMSSPIALEIVEPEHAVGSQFVLFIFPVGQVKFKDGSSQLFQILRRTFLLRGYTPISLGVSPPNPTSTSGPYQEAALPLVRVRVVNLSVNAFDLFFLRHIVAKVSLEGECSYSVSHSRANDSLSSLPFAKESAEGESDLWRPFAFQQELSFVAEKAVLQASADLVDQLDRSGCLHQGSFRPQIR